MLELMTFTFNYYFSYLVIVAFILKVCNAAFLYTQGYDKWYLGLIPFAHAYYKHELSGANVVWFILDSLFGVFAILTFHIVFIVLWWVVRSLADYKYASIFIDDYNPWIFAIIPFSKYVIMVKEVINYARNESR